VKPVVTLEAARLALERLRHQLDEAKTRGVRPMTPDELEAVTDGEDEDEDDGEDEGRRSRGGNAARSLPNEP
jgi:hypothetical protein